MFNTVIIVGHLTKDVEMKYSKSGSAIASSGIASSRKWKSKAGEQKEEVMFVDITFFGRSAEVANQYLRKGSKVLIEGRLTYQTWTAQDGGKRSKHIVTVETMQMLDSKADSQGGNNQKPQRPQQGYNSQQQGYTPPPQQGYTPPPQQGYNNSQQQGYVPPQPPQNPEVDLDDDEIPF